jgi:putative glutamine amidotransferase
VSPPALSRTSPVVGVTGGEQDAQWAQVWRARAVLVTTRYLRAVESAGGLPVVLPPPAELSEDAAADVAGRLVGTLDALVLTGGGDVEPARYGQDAHAATRPVPADRDRFEMALVHAAARKGLPVLAVCRGAQVLNVARGGSLHQHIPDIVGTDVHAPVTGGYGRHRVRVAADSVLGRILKPVMADDGTIDAPTNHHQAVDRPGPGLDACAWADDGTIEAVEDASHPFLVGVQWHPEAGEDGSLFRALVEATMGA